MSDPVDWLLDGDPALRWQTLRDLRDAPAATVAEERARVATEGWGARLLALRDPDGQWAGGACFPGGHDGSDPEPGQPWTPTLHTLALLRDLGLGPRSPEARKAVDLVAENCRWEHDDEPFFHGEVEECINGRTLALAAYFGVAADDLANRLLDAQLADGGWNCDSGHGSTVSSFATTLCVLEGLLELERATRQDATRAARLRGEEYLLKRHLFRRLSTGEVVNPAWQQFSFPTQWRYDVLRSLDYFREAGGDPDPRLDEALDLVRAKRQPDGRWLLENTHPGRRWFDLEDGDGQPSRWNTLRSLRVLRWAGA